MDQKKTPLFEALKNHVQKSPFSLHVPGHKSGTVFSEKALLYYKEILSLDVTELTGLDDLHEPTGAIFEAEELLSNLYGSYKSFFLVNGSTVGNLSMVLSVCGANDTVLVARNCHKSIMNALKIAGAKPVFLSPEFDTDVQVPTLVHEKDIIQAIEQFPNAKAVILTNPNYYGHTNELENVITYAHGKGIPVLVDEAHGAHFGVGQPFPESAVKSRADIVVQSAHKTLPAMTMGSYLHFQSDFISLERLEFYLKSLQSSSPSYPIMASLDLARSYLAEIKDQGVTELYNQIKEYHRHLSKIPQLSIVVPRDKKIVQDPLKILLQSRSSLSGYELQSLLEKNGIYTELSDALNVLCILPLAPQDLKRFTRRLGQVLAGVQSLNEEKRIVEFNKLESNFPHSYFELKSKKEKLVKIEESINQLSAETIIPYPPGIPLILQGEVITEAHLDQFMMLQRLGARFQGNGSTKNINIYDCD
jgi:arginine/lysine/ornithine decarboxylase